jgi:glucokinase
VTGRNVASAVLADIGGTNARFALLRDGVLGPIAHLVVADHHQFESALDAFLAEQPDRASIPYALFGLAGVVENERCALTNSQWIVDAKGLRSQFGFTDIHLVNDFEAVAWSLPCLVSGDLLQIGGGEPQPRRPMVVLGPGTGLGVAAYLPVEHGACVVHSEGGHVTLAGSSLREDAIITKLRQQFGHVSAERVLSGPGLENLFCTIAILDSLSLAPRSAAQITQAALAGACPTSINALETFCALLGAVAGNFALTFDSRGGVFIAGGIAGHLHEHLPRSQFRERFNAKGRMSGYLKAIPTYLILHEDPAFLGLQQLAAQQPWFS